MKKTRGGMFFLGLLAATTLQAADSSPAVRMLVLAKRNWLTQQVGQYDPARGWIHSDTYYDRPLQGTVYTLFGLAGKLAEVKTIDPMRLYRDGVPWSWEAHISSWPWQTQDEALGIKGSWPPPARVAQALPLDDPAAVRAAIDFLKRRHLDVPQPILTQVLMVDLQGDGGTEEILCAHSNDDALTDSAAAPVYAIALLVFQKDGKTETLPLDAYTTYKPAHRTLDDQAHLYGLRPFYRLIALPELFADGRLEIALTKNVGDVPVTQIDSFDGKKLKQQIASYIIER